MSKRMYGLFEKQDGKWVRLFPSHAYPKDSAIRLFQTQLINGFFEGKTRELRVLPKAKEVQHG